MWQSSVKGGAVLVGRHPLDRFIGSLSSAALERHCLQVLALTQAFAVILAGGLAKIIYLDLALGMPQSHAAYLAPALVLAIALHYAFKQIGLHRTDALRGPTIGFGRIWAALAVAFLLLLGGLYVLKIADYYSRGWFISWFALSAIALVFVRWAFMRGLQALTESGRLTRRFAVLGTESYVRALKGEFEKTAPNAVVSSIYLSDKSSGDECVDGDVIRELRAAIQANSYEEVIIALPARDGKRIRLTLRHLAPFAPEILLLTNLEPLSVPVHGSKAIGNLRAHVVSPVPAAESDRLEKRVLDVAAALAGLLLLSPLLLLTALAIKLDSPGPVFFRQRRYGRNSRVFRIFKFRTMTVAEDGEQVTQAKREDARVTRVGRILRASSIDEIPQLFNVLLGQMSVVGPRPHALAHEEQFEEKFDLFSRRRRVLPGITGWAQVNGYRGETKTPEDVEGRMNYDLYYIDNWSIWFDIEIMVRTAVAMTRGAY
jgi:Undecaprenyl-phosphate glucose phosphotransferase